MHGPRDKGKMVARDRAGLAQGPVGARKSGHIALTQMLRHGTRLASDPSAPGWCFVLVLGVELKAWFARQALSS